jgi:hypothetical protein
MKKMIALLLALALTLSCAAALAETTTEKKENLGTVLVNGAFTIEAKIPEGYTYKVIDADASGASLTAMLSTMDKNAPQMLISIYLNDSYEPHIRLNDVDEATLKAIEDSFQLDNDVTFTYTETAYGTKLLQVTEVGDDPDFVDFYTIYEGYEVELILGFLPEAEKPVLTENMVKTAVQFLSDMDFVPAN